MSDRCPTCGTRRNVIDDAVVRNIREQYAAGVAQDDLAELFGVTQGWVSRVVTGKLRQEAGGPIAIRRTNNRRVRA